MRKKLLNTKLWLITMMLMLFSSGVWADDTTITWAISGVNTSASGGNDVNTTLKTSSVTGGSGTWTAEAKSSFAGSSSGAQLGSGSYTFAGTLSLSSSSIPSTATIKSIGITLSSSGTAYKIDAKVGSTTFGSQVSVNQKASKTYSFSGSVVGNAITLTFSSGGKKNVIIKGISVKYSTTAQSTAPTIGGENTYTISQDVPLTSVDGATIYYTTDGTNPTTSTPTSVTSGETVTITNSCTIKAASKEDGKDLSAVTSKTFTKNLAVNSITVTDGNTHNIALTGVGAVTEHTLAATATSGGTVTYALKSATNLTEGTDFTFNTSTHKLSFAKTFKGIIVITASVAANADYAAASQDITINCDGDKRDPVIAYDGEDAELSSSGTLVIDEDLIETDGTITVESSNTDVATVSDYTISPVADGTTTITIKTAAGTYYNAGSGSFDLTVVTPEDCDIALTGAPVAKTFDLYNNATPHVIEYSTSSTGAVSIAANSYATFAIDQVNKKITITPKAKTPSTQTITINQAAAGKYLAGSTTFSLTVNNSATSETYEKVANDKTLAVGDIILLVDESAADAAGAFGSNTYMAAVDVDISTSTTPNSITITTESVEPLTLGGSSGAWTLALSNGDKLHTTAAKSLSASSTNATTWTISISEGNASITNTSYGTIRYNNSAPRFLNYATETGRLPQIYRRAKYANTITVINGNAQTLTLTSATELTLSSTSYCGAVSYTYKSASNLTKDTDFKFDAATGELVVDENAPSGTITITASTVESATHKAASLDIVITVVGKSKSDVEFALEDQTKLAGTTYTLENGVDFETDGVVTLSSSNTSVATVNNSTLTVTAKAVGTAKITVSCAEGTLYNEGSDEFYITVTAPAGSATVPSNVETVFEETFDKCEGKGGNDDSWSGVNPIAVSDKDYDGDAWTTSKMYASNKCLKGGTGSAGGSATTPNLTLEEGVVYTLTFKAAAWNATNESTSLDLSATNATLTDDEENTVSSVTTSKGEWASYTVYVQVVDESENATITFSTSSDNSRFFLDEVKVTKAGPTPTATVTLNKYGYATYCSQYPIDFSSTEGYTAWRVSSIKDGVISFAKITEKIKGGQGVLLYNKNADGVNTSSATIKFADGTTEFDEDENLLVGTTAPTYFEQDSFYGLSDNQFKKNDICTLPAGKAYLPFNKVNTGSAEIRNFTFVFEDNVTGIETIQNVSDEVIFDLTGRRLNRLQKGVNIVNGKKILVK